MVKCEEVRLYVANDFRQAWQKVVKFLVSLEVCLNLWTSQSGPSLRSSKAKRRRSRTPKSLQVMWLLNYYFCGPSQKWKRKNCDGRGPVWVTVTLSVTAYQWVLLSDSLLNIVAKLIIQPVFYWKFPLSQPGSIPEVIVVQADVLQTHWFLQLLGDVPLHRCYI